VVAVLVVILVYFIVSYELVPLLWRVHEHSAHPALDTAPKVSRNAYGIPGDPLNIGLIGSDEELVRAMHTVNWQPADPITFRSSLGIA
jgi:hypothetical protein